MDQSLKSLGSMYDDEVRAREQLNEIQELLKECKLTREDIIQTIKDFEE